MSALPVTPETDHRSWQEDFWHENGKYLCGCCLCGCTFFGYKRRIVCKECASKEAL